MCTTSKGELFLFCCVGRMLTPDGGTRQHIDLQMRARVCVCPVHVNKKERECRLKRVQSKEFSGTKVHHAAQAAK
jgi:hypothetical protein